MSDPLHDLPLSVRQEVMRTITDAIRCINRGERESVIAVLSALRSRFTRGEDMGPINDMLGQLLDARPRKEDRAFYCPNSECENMAFESGVCSACGSELEAEDVLEVPETLEGWPCSAGFAPRADKPK